MFFFVWLFTFVIVRFYKKYLSSFFFIVIINAKCDILVILQCFPTSRVLSLFLPLHFSTQCDSRQTVWRLFHYSTRAKKQTNKKNPNLLYCAFHIFLCTLINFRLQLLFISESDLVWKHICLGKCVLISLM